jgi:hypothetical protein
MRYTTSTSRALSHAIKELETTQAARKAREESAASMGAELAKSPAELNERLPVEKRLGHLRKPTEQLEQQGAKNVLGDTSALAEPEDAPGKDEAA